jgi:hypothetical protein
VEARKAVTSAMIDRYTGCQMVPRRMDWPVPFLLQVIQFVAFVGVDHRSTAHQQLYGGGNQVCSSCWIEVADAD